MTFRGEEDKVQLPEEPVAEQVPVEAPPAGPEELKPAAKKRRKRKPAKKKHRLLIVESPAKAKTINKFVGNRYVVMACMGHVRDLPSSQLGVDLTNNFAPKYVTVRGKRELLKELRQQAKKSESVYLATDPDREGEAISWHLKEALKLPDEKVRRVIFNEITRKVVKEAVDNATQNLNIKLVEAQQARRILDRLVGYSLSPLLWNKVRKGLSAGRVQSVAVRLICERESLIEAFVPVEYWSIEALFSHKGGKPFEAKLTQIDGEKVQIANEEGASNILKRLSNAVYRIRNVESKEQRRNPLPPFITSTLQQEAAKRYRFTAKRTMMIAQTLYEGVDLGSGTREGLITYMRTDSVRVSADAQREAREKLTELYGAEYVPAEPPVYKGRASSQDAHEAIRPTLVSQDPDGIKKDLTPDQFKLYKLIWQRFLASQAAPAILEQTAADIEADGALFRATGLVTKFPGFLALYHDTHEEGENDEEKEGALPASLKADDPLDLNELKPSQHFTQPPPRYSDASLVKALEEEGIGRPSTYAPIISTILDRGYVERRESRFHPTELGKLVNELLVKHFQDVINVQFTAQMEEKLDEVEGGSVDWTATLRDFHTPFVADLEKARTEMRDVKSEMEELTDIDCDKCGKKMIVRWGRHGRFLACTGYPECRNAKSFENDANGNIVIQVPVVTDEKCNKCGSPMVIRTGRFGKFLACQRYPECRETRPIPLDFKCPRKECNGNLVMRRSRRGRVFYGCSKYPDCNFVSWNPPVKEKCPTCGCDFLTEKKLKMVRRVACPVEGCGYEAEFALEAMQPAPQVPANPAGEVPIRPAGGDGGSAPTESGGGNGGAPPPPKA